MAIAEQTFLSRCLANQALKLKIICNREKKQKKKLLNQALKLKIICRKKKKLHQKNMKK